MKARCEFRKLKEEPSTYMGDGGKKETKMKYRLYLSDDTGEGLDLRIAEGDVSSFANCVKGDEIEVIMTFKDAAASLGGGKGTYPITQLASCVCVAIVDGQPRPGPVSQMPGSPAIPAAMLPKIKTPGAA